MACAPSLGRQICGGLGGRGGYRPPGNALVAAAARLRTLRSVEEVLAVGVGAELQRFVTAQDAGDTCDPALAELRRGVKVAHCCGSSSRRPPGSDKARPATGMPCRGQGNSGLPRRPGPGTPAAGGPGRPDRSCRQRPGGGAPGIDAVKLRSSTTLFARAAADPALNQRGTAVLGQSYEGIEDPATLALI